MHIGPQNEMWQYETRKQPILLTKKRKKKTKKKKKLIISFSQ
jgi:hypothetical protein